MDLSVLYDNLLFRTESEKLIYLDSDEILFIGDLHGDYLSFKTVRQYIATYCSKNATIVFLGDIIDRGDDEIDIFKGISEMIEYGRSVYIIKGNHEMFFDANKDTLYQKSDKKMIHMLNKLFNDTMPYCIIFKKQGIFAIHGGFIDDSFYNDLTNYQYMVELDDMVQAVFNDLYPYDTFYLEDGKRRILSKNDVCDERFIRNHDRDGGLYFTNNQTDKIFKRNKWLKYVVRGHSHYNTLDHENRIFTIVSCEKLEKKLVVLHYKDGKMGVKSLKSKN
jgi:predicted phosphodiesterase